jgi:hypothetical protein
MARLAAAEATWSAVLVEVDPLSGSELQFFELAARYHWSVPVFVFGSERASEKREAALVRGARGTVDADGVEDVLRGLTRQTAASLTTKGEAVKTASEASSVGGPRSASDRIPGGEAIGEVSGHGVVRGTQVDEPRPADEAVAGSAADEPADGPAEIDAERERRLTAMLDADTATGDPHAGPEGGETEASVGGQRGLADPGEGGHRRQSKMTSPPREAPRKRGGARVPWRRDADRPHRTPPPQRPAAAGPGVEPPVRGAEPAESQDSERGADSADSEKPRSEPPLLTQDELDALMGGPKGRTPGGDQS